MLTVKTAVISEAWITLWLKSCQSYFICPVCGLTPCPRFCFSTSVGLYAFLLGWEGVKARFYVAEREI